MPSDWQYDAERERQIAERNDVAMQQVVASVMCDKYDVAYLLGALAAAREALEHAQTAIMEGSHGLTRKMNESLDEIRAVLGK